MLSFITLASLLAIALIPAAVCQAATRVAIIPTGPNALLKDIAAVAEAELSGDANFALLERAQIDHVIAEQKLSLTGMVDPPAAVRVGQILTADLLVLLESEAGDTQFGIVIFDPATGVQLWNAAAKSSQGEKAAAELAAGVRAATAKRADVAHRKTVCILAVRNGDLSRDFDSICDAVGTLTQRTLVSSPAVAMLERTRLDQVTRERGLAADASTRDLLASLITIDLEIDRGSAPGGLKAIALLSDSSSRSLGKVVVESTNPDAAALASALVTSLSQNLNTPATAPLDNRAEAARFCNEALFRILNSDFAHAVPPAEAAHALAPDHLAYRAVLARSLIDAGWQQFRIPPGGFNHGRGGWEDHSVAPPGVLRGARMVLDNQLQPTPADASALALARDQSLDAIATLRNFLSQANHFHRDNHEPLTTSDIPTLQGDLRRIVLAENQRHAAAPIDQLTFDVYSDSVVQLLNENYSLFGVTSAQWAADLNEIMQLWLAAKARASAACRSREMRVLEYCAIGWQFNDFGVGFIGQRQMLWPIGPAERESLGAVRKLLDANADPVVRSYTNLFDLSFSLPQEPVAPDALKGIVSTFIARQTAALATAATPSARQADYRMMVVADALLDRTPFDGLFSEPLVTTMLAHHDFFPVVINRATRLFPGEAEASANARRSRVLQSAQATLGLPDCSLSDGDSIANEKRFVDAMMHTAGWGVNQRMVLRNPPPAPQIAGATGYGSTRLIDLVEVTSSTACIYAPRADGRFVYTLAAVDTGDSGPYQMQLLKIPLAGGKPETLGTLPSAYTDRINNPPGKSGSLVTLVRDATLADGYYAAAVYGCGVMLFPTSGDEAIQLDESAGLPVRSASNVAILDGIVYAALGGKNKETYIAAYNLASKQATVLASSVRKDRQSPFDDGSAFDVVSLLPDPARKRLIVAVVRRDETAAKVTGLWEFKPANRAWRQLLPINVWLQRSENRTGSFSTGIDFVRSAGPDALLVRVSGGLFRFDLTLDQPQQIQLEATGVASIPRETPRMPGLNARAVSTIEDIARTGPGWQSLAFSNIQGLALWTLQGRLNLADGSFQIVEAPRPQDHAGLSILAPTPDGRLILGDNWGLVLIDPRPNHLAAHAKLTPFLPASN